MSLRYVFEMFIAVVRCYILTAPDHQMVSAGSNAYFSCQSTVPNGISWYYKPVNGVNDTLLTNDTLLPSGATVFNSYSPDSKRSILSFRGVRKKDSGTLKCSDNDRAAFARLTVVSGK